jgi:Phosphopantetheinyl transferase
LDTAIPELIWPPKPRDLSLGDSDIHVVAVPLNAVSEQVEAARNLLADDERERAARFRFEKHQRRFILARAGLRRLLGDFLGIDSRTLQFNYAAHGKPALQMPALPFPLHFNLSHSGELALVAVSRQGPIGVDVEWIRSVKDADDLVARFFSNRENALFQKLPPVHKPEAFFNLWTRKEALLKATGEGITGGLNRVEVSFLPGEPAELREINGSAEAACNWKLFTLAPAQGWTGAVAISFDSTASPLTLQTWTFAPPRP